MDATFSKIFKELRIKNDMLQSDIASELGVSRAAIYKWEKAKSEPNLETLRQIADIFNVDVAVLTGEKDITLTKQLSQDADEVLGFYEELCPENRLVVKSLIINLLSAQKAIRKKQ